MLHITAAQNMYNLVIHLQLVPHMISVSALLMFQAAFGCSPGIIPQHAGRSLCVPPVVFPQMRQMLPLLQKSYMYASVSNNDAAHYGRFFFFQVLFRGCHVANIAHSWVFCSVCCSPYCGLQIILTKE